MNPTNLANEAEDRGLNQPTLSRILAGKQDPSEEVMQNIAEAIQDEFAKKGIHRDGYIIGRYMDVDDKPESGSLITTQLKSVPDSYSIPQYDTGGAMGYGGVILADQPGIIHRLEVSREWIEKNIRGYSSISNLCIVTGFGPSMKGMFNPGDPLVIDRGYRICDIDAPFFFRISEHGFIKILQRLPVAGKIIIRAKSKNPDYDPFDITEDMDFEIFGRVMKAWRSEDF
jgi:phage repressor protein C with HTH and peptisase S24 domain